MKRSGVVAIALLALVLSACTGTSNTKELTVSAASSLTSTFTEIAAAFEATHPGVTVKLNFGGSSTLAEQINSGAPVDVFAAASPATMATAVKAGNVNNPVAFTGNTLQIAVPKANPAQVSTLADLAASTTKVVVCAKEVPCGAAAAKLFEQNKLTVQPVSLEPDVKSVIAKIAANEADAGVVYVTDVLAAGANVTGFEIPTNMNVYTEYEIGATTRNRELADEFIAFVQSTPAQIVLTKAGFATQ